ncbi:PREDICTED: 6-phosphogluconolactonase [Trachymyrmex cornetzi]|uniref:6-phosphogluconolactonase n=1 Tax=Trachymyrmex cornetzi TaxID=471704 RepID=UPI00084F1E8B|nr:PREDICTED: 6-phosphogluconolactonase [Trachymyrmex cornetzi]
MTGIVVATDEEQLLSRISNLIARAADDAISRDDRIFRFGVSGGSVVQLLAKSLPNIATDWSKWRFFFCDERVVPLDDSESNFGLYKSCLIGKVPVTEEQFMKVDPELNAPPSRISLTMPVINNARMCVFIVTGASKAEIVKRILRDKEDLPATRVEPVDGTLFWLLDQEAGRLLNSD